ncbi:MAG: GNAT family N-acetyltransferase [Thermoguttaceae bacterium]|jgi:GNAT superfamily N-acetyltransferase
MKRRRLARITEVEITIQDKLAINQLKMRIRKACSDDAAAAWEIRNAAILSQCKGHYPPESLAIWTNGAITERFIQFVVEQIYVATVNDAVVGTGMIDRNTGRLDAIFVRPDMMRHGIGKQMVSFLEDIGRAAGLTKLTLDSTLNAAEFYRSCGFVGEVIGIYQSPRGITLDCIPMTKVLRSPP